MNLPHAMSGSQQTDLTNFFKVFRTCSLAVGLHYVVRVNLELTLELALGLGLPKKVKGYG